MKASRRKQFDAPPDFDALARVYRWMEWASFGPLLMICRCAFLDLLGSARHAVVLGDGDGRFTARLLCANTLVQVDAVDASRSMLDELLRHAGHHANRVRTCCTDARAWRPLNASYDLVVTHFFLDCLTAEEIKELAVTLSGVLGPQGQWLVSEFAIPEGWYGRLVARPLVAGLYWAFGWLTGLRIRALSDFRSALSGVGLTLRHRKRWLGGLLVSELWSI